MLASPRNESVLMAVPSTERTVEHSATAALAAFIERRSLVMLALGFSAGLPFLLIFDTLSAWLRVAGLSLEVIGFFSLTTLIYSFKFLWAPLIDRARVPLLTSLLGHRRSWMLLCQTLIMLGLWLVAGGDPAINLAPMAVFAVFVGFSSATQDVVIDAWRIEVVDETRQGVMAAAYQWGYRVAIIVAGAAPLLLAESYGWNFSYAVMAALMAIGMLAVVLAPRESRHVIRPVPLEGVRVSRALEIGEWLLRLFILAVGAVLLGSGLAGDARLLSQALSGIGLVPLDEWLVSAWRPPYGVWFQLAAVLLGFAVIAVAALPFPGTRTRPGLYLAAALGDPLRDFFVRYRGTAAIILALICTYRLSDFVLNIMNPFYIDLGFTLTEVAEVRKIFGVAASVLGVFAGGFSVARFGLMPTLLVGAFAGPLSNVVFIWLATQGHSVPALFVAIGVDNVLGGFSGTALIAYMSSLTAEGFTATQYALFSSLYALPGRIIASQSGALVEGAAQSAESGGLFSLFNSWFVGLTPESFAQSIERSGVSAPALGSGYTVFFIYSALVGAFAVVLAFVVAARSAKREPAGRAAYEAPS
jgi:PAT family beta-lactamase induction signal transducer AmpG